MHPSLEACLALAVALFATGAYGVLSRRNLLIVLISVEVMLNAVGLAFVAFARALNAAGLDGGGGQVFALCLIALAATETVVGLSIVLLFFRLRATVDTRDMASLKE